MGLRTCRRRLPFDAELDARHSLIARRVGDAHGEKAGVCVKGSCYTSQPRALVEPALPPHSSPDAVHFFWLGEHDFEEWVEDHRSSGVSAARFVFVDDALEDPF